jgi:hypothetical protein
VSTKSGEAQGDRPSLRVPSVDRPPQSIAALASPPPLVSVRRNCGQLALLHHGLLVVEASQDAGRGQRLQGAAYANAGAAGRTDTWPRRRADWVHRVGGHAHQLVWVGKAQMLRPSHGARHSAPQNRG